MKGGLHVTRRIVVALAALLPGFAWTNRNNRHVWNAFVEHVVPEDGTWFAVTLSLTGGGPA